MLVRLSLDSFDFWRGGFLLLYRGRRQNRLRFRPKDPSLLADPKPGVLKVYPSYIMERQIFQRAASCVARENGRGWKMEDGGPRIDPACFAIFYPQSSTLDHLPPRTSHWIRRARGMRVKISTIASVPTTLMTLVAQRAPISAASPPMNIAPTTRMTCVM